MGTFLEKTRDGIIYFTHELMSSSEIKVLMEPCEFLKSTKHRSHDPKTFFLYESLHKARVPRKLSLSFNYVPTYRNFAKKRDKKSINK